MPNTASKKPAPVVVISCSEQKPLASDGLPEFVPVGAITWSRSVMMPEGWEEKDS